MKPFPFISSILALSLSISAPEALAHVGHGDEFQATGGVNRVEVNAETDSLLGIQVNPIEVAADGSDAVLIPVSALVDDNGRQLVFVQYENFYEPVDVTPGVSQGELIEITEGLSVGEQLVTQGSLSLYAESRKTQTVEAAPSPEEFVDTQGGTVSHAEADAQGIPHNHGSDGNTALSEDVAQVPRETNQPAWEFPFRLALATTGGFAMVAAGFTLANRSRKKSSVSSEGNYPKNKGSV